MKIVVAALLAVCVCNPIAHAQPIVFFMPSDHSGKNAPEVTSQADFPVICSTHGGLKGLDLVRAFAGVATCQRTRSSTQFDVAMDIIILVDDTRPLSKYMLQMLAENNLLQPYKGRQVVRPGVLPIANGRGGDSGKNLLVVGEMAFRQLGSDAPRWYGSLLDIVGDSGCQLPAEELQTIERFATELSSLNISLQTTMLQALNNFGTAMTFASSYDVEPKVGAALMQTAFSQARSYTVGAISKVVPGFDIAVALYDGAQDEIERAGVAGQSYAMSRWIQASRDTITDCTGMYRCDGDSAADRTKVSEVDIREIIELEICRLPENRHEAGIESIEIALNKLMVRQEPRIKSFEKDIYERWINGYYDESAALRPGSIQGTIRDTVESRQRISI